MWRGPRPCVLDEGVSGRRWDGQRRGQGWRLPDRPEVGDDPDKWALPVGGPRERREACWTSQREEAS